MKTHNARKLLVTIAALNFAHCGEMPSADVDEPAAISADKDASSKTPPLTRSKANKVQTANKESVVEVGCCDSTCRIRLGAALQSSSAQ